MSASRWLLLAGTGAAALAFATCPPRREALRHDRPEQTSAPAPAPVPDRKPTPAPGVARAPPGVTATPGCQADERSPTATEESLTARLRDEVDSNPSQALELAREGEERFPTGAHADERAFLKMRALVNLGRIAPARDEADAFLARHPDSPYAERVYRLTGVHPRPPPPGAR